MGKSTHAIGGGGGCGKCTCVYDGGVKFLLLWCIRTN